MVIKCSTCSRSFKTPQALAQHSRAGHPSRKSPPSRNGGGGRGNPGSSAKRTNINTSATANRRETGTDMIGQVSVTAPSSVGKHLVDIQVSPRNFVGTRLHATSSLWARWKPIKLVLRVVPSAGTYVSGSYSIGWTADVADRIGSSASAVRKISSYRPNATAHIANQVTLVIPPESSQKWYVFGKEVVDECHGAVHMVMSSPIAGSTSGSVYGFTLHLDWQVEFSGPDLVTAGEVGHVYARDDYVPYYTDSITDWAEGKKMTFKHSAGQSAVVFVGGESGVVYKIDDKAKIPYYTNAAGGTGNIQYITPIHNYKTGTAMACFATLDGAKKYATSGDDADALDYFKPGEWGTGPQNPVYTQVTLPMATLTLSRGSGEGARPVRPADLDTCWEILETPQA